MFENRTIPLMVVTDWKPPWRPLFSVFADLYGAYERHVYKIPGAVLTGPIRALQTDWGLEMLATWS